MFSEHLAVKTHRSRCCHLSLSLSELPCAPVIKRTMLGFACTIISLLRQRKYPYCLPHLHCACSSLLQIVIWSLNISDNLCGRNSGCCSRQRVSSCARGARGGMSEPISRCPLPLCCRKGSRGRGGDNGILPPNSDGSGGRAPSEGSVSSVNNGDVSPPERIRSARCGILPYGRGTSLFALGEMPSSRAIPFPWICFCTSSHFNPQTHAWGTHHVRIPSSRSTIKDRARGQSYTLAPP